MAAASYIHTSKSPENGAGELRERWTKMVYMIMKTNNAFRPGHAVKQEPHQLQFAMHASIH
jgi:hypothetical protein